MSASIRNIEAALVEGLIPGFSGNAYYVATSGNDNDNNGADFDNAFATIDHAYNQCAAGDIVLVAPGIYDEDANGANGVECDAPSITIAGVGAGVVVTNTDTTNDGSVFLITAANVRIVSLTPVKGETTSTGSAGVKFDTGASGSFTVDSGVLIGNAPTHIGTQFTGGAVQCSIKSSIQFTAGAVGLNSVGIGVDFDNCVRCTVGSAILADLGTGIQFGANANLCGINFASIVFGCTVGVELLSGATNNFPDAAFAGNGTDIVDNSGNATNNATKPFASQEYEQTFPVFPGDGTVVSPVTVNNATEASQAQHFWGDIVALVAPDTLTAQWNAQGLLFLAVAFADVQPFQVFFTQPDFASIKSGGNAWDPAEITLSVMDGSLFQTDDFVWITADERPSGEIQKVVSVSTNDVTTVTETRDSANTGLRYTYTTNAKMYLVRRATDPRFLGFDGLYSASGARDWGLYRFGAVKEIPANGGALMRMENITDAGASSFEVVLLRK